MYFWKTMNILAWYGLKKNQITDFRAETTEETKSNTSFDVSYCSIN